MHMQHRLWLLRPLSPHMVWTKRVERTAHARTAQVTHYAGPALVGSSLVPTRYSFPAKGTLYHAPRQCRWAATRRARDARGVDDAGRTCKNTRRQRARPHTSPGDADGPRRDALATRAVWAMQAGHAKAPADSARDPGAPARTTAGWPTPAQRDSKGPSREPTEEQRWTATMTRPRHARCGRHRHSRAGDASGAAPTCDASGPGCGARADRARRSGSRSARRAMHAICHDAARSRGDRGSAMNAGDDARRARHA